MKVEREFQKCVTHLASGRLSEAIRLVEKTPELKSFSMDDHSLLHYARRDGLCCLSALLEAGVHPDIRDSGGYTMLMDASSAGSIKVVKILLRHAASVNLVSHSGETAFSFACAEGRLAVAKILYRWGADVNHEVAPNSKPLDWVRGDGRQAPGVLA